MCGIVGYIGNRQAVPLIIGGLEKLEYRGYDSAGVCALDISKSGASLSGVSVSGNNAAAQLSVARATGKLSELKKLLLTQPVPGTIGLGHTRWATHGRPTENNAHPHTAGRVSLIHNGIIENYAELRRELEKNSAEKSGAKFSSETDTEVGAHLLNHYLQQGLAPLAALQATCDRIRGSYAFLAIDTAHPDRILVAKNSTPIVIGVCENEMFVASDIPALLEHTRSVIILEDGDIAEVRQNSVSILHNGQPVTRAPQHISWDAVTAQKGGFKHFMLKEIFEQGRVVADTLRSRIAGPLVANGAGAKGAGAGEATVTELGLSVEQLSAINRISIVACGTAWHAGLVTKFFIEQFARVPVEVDYASEFRYRNPVLEEGTLVLAISQSGETADTLAAIDLAVKVTKGHVAAICNVVGSSLARKIPHTIFTHAGPEISVASTKAFTTQVTAGLLLAIALGSAKGSLSGARVSELLEELAKLPAALEHALECAPEVERIAKKFCKARDFLFIGRGSCYPIALEGALKLKEISYIHAEGYPAGELKHGPIALIDENMPVVVVVQRSALTDKVLSNLREVESRGGRIIAVTDEEPGSSETQTTLAKYAEEVIYLPFVASTLSPMILTLPLQLLAYYVAVQNGTDVDLPRNLAKSVTVE